MRREADRLQTERSGGDRNRQRKKNWRHRNKWRVGVWEFKNQNLTLELSVLSSPSSSPSALLSESFSAKDSGATGLKWNHLCISIKQVSNSEVASLATFFFSNGIPINWPFWKILIQSFWGKISQQAYIKCSFYFRCVSCIVTLHTIRKQPASQYGCCTGSIVEPRYLWCGELHFWVVFNLPQSLIESFPLVGLGILLFIGQVREDVFRAEKCTVWRKTLNMFINFFFFFIYQINYYVWCWGGCNMHLISADSLNNTFTRAGDFSE